jgi:outer membrane protein OmpA-like peptidoglycan-associated protein
MNSDTADRSQSRATIGGMAAIRVLNLWITALVCALVAACASPPPAPAATAPAKTRAEIIYAALKALDFEQRDDGYHLSLPAPLIFPFDSDVVAATARDTLIRVGRELRELGIDRALVRGHTDNVGANDYNLALSKRRADAVAKVLVDGGYPAEKIDAKGLGYSVPVADNTTSEGRSKNRRVVIIVQLI